LENLHFLEQSSISGGHTGSTVGNPIYHFPTGQDAPLIHVFASMKHPHSEHRLESGINNGHDKQIAYRASRLSPSSLPSFSADTPVLNKLPAIWAMLAFTVVAPDPLVLSFMMPGPTLFRLMGQALHGPVGNTSLPSSLK